MSDPKDEVPMDLDASFLIPLDVPSAPAPAPAPIDFLATSPPAPAPPAPAPAPAPPAAAPAPAAPTAPAAPAGPAVVHTTATFPLIPLPADAIPAAFAKAVDPSAPVPGRMMAARALAPIPPKALVPIVYQLLMDPDAKVAAAAYKTFTSFDEKLVGPALGDALPPQVLEALAHVLIDRFAHLERIVMNRATPDGAFAFLARNATDAKVITVVVENQERLLRCHDIARGLSNNPKALRSDIDRAVDFLVREGVYLDDVSEFEDAFLRLGKSEMLAVLKNIKVKEEHLSERERQKAAELGMSADDFISSGAEVLTEEEREALLAELEDDDPEAKKEDWSKMPFMKLPIPIQIKLAMTGPHEKAIEALNSSNRVVAGSAIRNPKIKENDVVKISRSKTMHEDVIRYICGNGDWTKSYSVKLNLVMNPKTPPSLVSRWLPLMRQTDLRALAKSKQVPSAVAIMAKRLMSARDQ
jgi:hypothetical protein